MSWLTLGAGILIGLIVAVLFFVGWIVHAFYHGY